MAETVPLSVGDHDHDAAGSVPLRGVLLYGLARPSLQPEGEELSALPAARLEDLGRRVGAFLPVAVSP